MNIELTNKQKKKYASLANAKGRKEWGLFMAQGTKCVMDTICDFEAEALFSTEEWALGHSQLSPVVVRRCDLEAMTTLQTIPEVIAIYRIPKDDTPLDKLALLPSRQLSLALDCIQDPGNMGTIVRLADWMGVTHIFASRDCVDIWNPKTVQATMGAISRVKVHYVDLPIFLKDLTKETKIYGTFLNGESIYKARLSQSGIIVMGNEGNGIRAEVEDLITDRLTIPPYSPHTHSSESLNVAIATAIVLSEFRRNG